MLDLAEKGFKTLLFFLKDLFIYLRERQQGREQAHELGEGQVERERENLKQTPR